MPEWSSMADGRLKREERGPAMGTIVANVWRGRYSLIVTYWVYGVAGGMLWGSVLSAAPSGSALALLALLSFIAYGFIVNTGIWRAATRYRGLRLWRVLARLGALFGYLVVLVLIAAVFSGDWRAISWQVPARQEGTAEPMAKPHMLDDRRL